MPVGINGTRKADRIDEFDTGCDELGLDGRDRAVEVDGAAGVANDDGRKAEAASVESGITDAIVIGQADEEDAGQVAFAEIASKTGRGGAVILEKCGIGVDLRAKPFAQNEFCLGQAQSGMEFSTRRALDAVVGPESLRAVGHFGLLEGMLAGVGVRKRGVMGAVPVLGEEYVVEARGDAMNDRNDFIAARNGERAAGAEVVLHVDDEEGVLRVDLQGVNGNPQSWFRDAPGFLSESGFCFE